MKRTIAKNFGWSLYEIDETDFGNLFAYINYDPSKDDPNTRVIDGKEYKRATKPPAWL